jgi:hypothetical protein
VEPVSTIVSSQAATIIAALLFLGSIVGGILWWGRRIVSRERDRVAAATARGELSHVLILTEFQDIVRRESAAAPAPTREEWNHASH